MRVLMLTLGYPKHPGDPTAPFIDAIARSLAARGHSIDIVLPYHPEFRDPALDGIRFFPYRYSPFRDFAPWGFGQTFGAKASIRLQVLFLLPVIALSLQRSIARRLARHDYDLVHAHWVLPNGWLAVRPARAHGVPLLISLHGSDVAIAERQALLGRLARNAFRQASAVTAPSANLSTRARSLGADERTTETIRYGVDADAFSPRAATPALRTELGLTEREFLIVSVGRLAEVKGFAYLIDALPLIENATAVVIGDGELRSELEERIRRTRASVVLFGSMPHDQLPDAIAAADVVVVPSVVDRAGRVDGLPNTVLEGLASGRPLVATRVGGIPEIVEDGYNGLLVAPEDPGALVEAIQRLRRDAELRHRLGRQARKLAVDHLSWDATAVGFERVYERIVNVRG